jgi:hypothetical protein
MYACGSECYELIDHKKRVLFKIDQVAEFRCEVPDVFQC